jgi:hypothetical protein
MPNMLSITKQILPVITLVLIISGASAATTERLEDFACYGELQKPLFESGYVGGDCIGVKVKIKKVGDISVKGSKFSVFDLRYKTIPEPGTSARGGERILTIEDNKTYVGQYYLPSVPGCKMHIQGQTLYLDVPKEYGDHISFEGGGPPAQAHVDGYVVDLYK